MSSEQPPHRAGLREWVTSIIALIITGLWALAIGRLVFAPSQENIQAAQSVSAILGPIMGAVLGYYFGSQAGERAAREAEGRLERLRDTAREQITNTSGEYELLRQRLRALEQALVNKDAPP